MMYVALACILGVHSAVMFYFLSYDCFRVKRVDGLYHVLRVRGCLAIALASPLKRMLNLCVTRHVPFSACALKQGRFCIGVLVNLRT